MPAGLSYSLDDQRLRCGNAATNTLRGGISLRAVGQQYKSINMPKFTIFNAASWQNFKIYKTIQHWFYFADYKFISVDFNAHSFLIEKQHVTK